MYSFTWLNMLGMLQVSKNRMYLKNTPKKGVYSKQHPFSLYFTGPDVKLNSPNMFKFSLLPGSV
jgi:hypothetical protein